MHNNLLHIEISCWDHLFWLLKPWTCHSPLCVTRVRMCIQYQSSVGIADTCMNVRNTLLVLLEIT